ncbi:MAG: type I methionyl aminopeptidase [Candidatus Omnitrophota bacterium]|nr:type I methionyl aminopeptidase [Candidatus Omnitrophota bacterium]
MVELKTEENIAEIRRAGRVLAKVFIKIQKKIAPGISTQEIDNWIKSSVEEYGGSCAFFGYRNYPANSCISVNEEVVHGVPSLNKVLKEGDIVSVDIGVKLGRYCVDAAVTYPVGNIDRERKKLIDATRKALELGIREAYPGNFLSNISCRIQRYVESCGFSVVRDLAGHGIGQNIHEDPEIPNYGRPDCGIKLKKGMVLAIEPMVNVGNWEVEVLSDGWTVVTKDRSPSAHFEHTIAILDNGPEILTRL